MATVSKGERNGTECLAQAQEEIHRVDSMEHEVLSKGWALFK